MANFAVSILDGTTYDVTIQNGVVTITDHSNYDDNTESGHYQVNFEDYKKIYVTDPNGNEYVFSSLGDGDALINAPQGQTLPISTLYTSTGDGVYTLILETIPTWAGIGGIYSLTDEHHVYYNGKIYRSLQDGNFNKNPETQTTYWEEVEAEDLPVKYRLEYKFAVACDLINCFQQLTYSAICAIESLSCQSNLCSNTYFVNARKLNTILEHISVLAANNDWDRVTSVINLGSQICACTDSTTTCNCGG
jgi:hypothetical protein